MVAWTERKWSRTRPRTLRKFNWIRFCGALWWKVGRGKSKIRWKVQAEMFRMGASRRLYCPVTAVPFELCFLLLSRDICIVCQAWRLCGDRNAIQRIYLRDIFSMKFSNPPFVARERAKPPELLQIDCTESAARTMENFFTDFPKMSE